jgi:hypothetical protein
MDYALFNSSSSSSIHTRHLIITTNNLIATFDVGTSERSSSFIVKEEKKIFIMRRKSRTTTHSRLARDFAFVCFQNDRTSSNFFSLYFIIHSYKDIGFFWTFYITITAIYSVALGIGMFPMLFHNV